MDNNIKSIVEGDIDLYDFLGAASDAAPEQIRRLYRKKALQYHPDKQDGDATKFDLLSKVYTVLSDSHLRDQYNSIRSRKIARDTRDQELDDLTKAFKQELEAKERLQQQQADLALIKQLRQAKIRMLAMDGRNRVRKLEAELRNNNSEYVSHKELETPSRHISFDNVRDKSVVVKWKFKEILRDSFSEDVLREIMSSFGRISRVSMWNHVTGERYDYGTVEYENFHDAFDATQHDYSRSASRWDGTNVRKLASLLRSCEFRSDYNDRTGKLDFEDVISPMLEEKHIRYQKNIHLDKVLFPYMGKQLLQEAQEASK